MLCSSWYCLEVIEFKGHKNIQALHRTTFEITKDKELTPRGDCIIGVSANKALKDFNEKFKDFVRDDKVRIYIILLTENGAIDMVKAWGSKALTYDDTTKVVVRRSNYVAGSTAAVKSDKAAKDLSRELIQDLKRGVKGLALFIALKTS